MKGTSQRIVAALAAMAKGMGFDSAARIADRTERLRAERRASGGWLQKWSVLRHGSAGAGMYSPGSHPPGTIIRFRKGTYRVRECGALERVA